MKKKSVWEKELLGVSLSYNPLMSLAAADVGDGINSIDQLDEDMQGLTYTLLGHVAAVTERYTREQKKFLVVNFDLLGGPVEVLVWPDVLERTAELWSAGKLLRATGKLRLRGDGYSLACDQVAPFVPPDNLGGDSGEESAARVMKESKAPAPTAANGHSDGDMVGAPEGQRRNNGNGGGNSSGNNGNGANGSYRHQPNGGYRPRANGNGAGYGNGNGNGGRSGNGSAREANGNGGNTTVSFASARTVFVGITESEDPVEDAHLLREVIALLLEYPGKDRVNLEIYTGGRRVILDFAGGEHRLLR